MDDTLTIAAHLNGPPDSANGGIICGELALRLGQDAEVTLRMPPPLQTPLQLRPTPDGLALRLATGEVVASARVLPLELEPLSPVTHAQAEASASRFVGHRQHAFPTCFSCGPARSADEALRILPGPVSVGAQSPVAGAWTPRASLQDPQQAGHVHPRYLAAAIDCAGAWAIWPRDGRTVVLGRMQLGLREAPPIAEPCVVMGWALGNEGRKFFAGTAAYGQDGRLLALSRQTWIALGDVQ